MILHEQVTADGSVLSIRSAGRSRRLYRNGVFHTQWHPDRVFDDSVWSLLALSSLFAVEHDQQPQRALLLGVAGGAVMHCWRHLFPTAALTGVELCPDHVAVGKKWFGLRGKYIDLQQGDAVAWLQAYDGPPFDVIVEDCFDATNPHVERSVPLTKDWCRILASNVAVGGVIAINSGGLGDLRRSGFVLDATLRRRFSAQTALHVRDEMNRIGVFVDGGDPKVRLKTCIAAWPDPAQRRAMQKVDVQQRRIS